MNTIISVKRFIFMFSQVEDREPGTEEKPGKKR